MKKHRRDFILSELNKKSYVSVAYLQKELNVTEMTIRRDLKELESEGSIMRVHGGAQRLESAAGVQPSLLTLHHEERMQLNTEKKHIIAKKAASLICDQDVIFISASTTNELIAQYIGNKSIRLVTNCLYIFFQYHEMPNVEAILIGGKYNDFLQSFLGAITLESLKTVTFTKAFVGTNAITNNKLYASNDEEGLLHMTALDNARERYVVCDSTKFNTDAFFNFYNCDQLTAIITDNSEIPNILDYREIISII